jgi:hypothetical protein
MKDAWSEENDKIEFTTGFESLITKAHRPSLLAGLTQPPDRSTIVASLPSRSAADKLIARFFDSYNPAIPARCEFIQFAKVCTKLMLSSQTSCIKLHFSSRCLLTRFISGARRANISSITNTGLIPLKQRQSGSASCFLCFA